jgi:hypothetical protein
MKTRLIFFLSLLLALGSYAQKVHFSDTTNKWVTTFGYGGSGASNWNTIYSYYNYADSSAEWNGKTYHVLIRNGMPIALVREDTALQKVFLKPIETFYGDYLKVRSTGEFVYMDYSLQVNDTLEMPLTYNNSFNIDTPATSKHVVVAIDSILMNNIWHKVFTMQVVSGFEFGGHYTWIEGMGSSTTGPIIEPAHPPGGINKMICFQNKGTYPIASLTACDNPAGINPAGLDNKVSFEIFPNPASTTLSVHADKSGREDCIVSLSDCFGRNIYTKRFKHQVQIDVSAFAEGLYFLQLQQGNNTVARKIIITHY